MPGRLDEVLAGCGTAVDASSSADLLEARDQLENMMDRRLRAKRPQTDTMFMPGLVAAPAAAIRKGS